MTGTRPTSGPITFLLKRFPRLSETFILNELLALERQGVQLRIYSILDPEEKVVHADVARLRTRVEYFPHGLTGAWGIARAHFSLLVATPRSYLRTLGEAVSRRRRTAIKHFFRAGWLAAQLRHAGAAHLHAHFAHGPASVAQFASSLAGVPFSFTAHAKDIYTSPPELLQAKLRAAQFVVTCTEYNASHLAGLAGEPWARRIHRIYHGIDFDRFRSNGKTSGQHASPPVLLSIGRFVEKKGFLYLIEAARILAAHGRSFQVRLVGGGEQRRALEAQIARAGLQRTVELCGPLPQEKLLALYENAAVCVLPCVVTDNGDRDGIPNVLVEAMRMGVPVVSTAISGIPELVIDGQTGVLVPPRDPQALAAAIIALLDDPERAHRLAVQAARHVAERFDLHRNAERLRQLLEAGAA
ncbi:MAG TPA: glycosyltransferase family 4 protein [Polyangia bacterium]|nr:glycosyltransferase family 4 protein [Polyangia bacterium]